MLQKLVESTRMFSIISLCAAVHNRRNLGDGPIPLNSKSQIKLHQELHSLNMSAKSCARVLVLRIVKIDLYMHLLL